MEEQLEALRRLIAQNKHIVFFGGAGVSTDIFRLHCTYS